MQTKTTVASPEAPPALGPYSQAVKVNDTVYVSGQLPIDAKTGQLALQNGMRITKTQSGEIIYESDTSRKAVAGAAVSYNELTVPRGGQFRLLLPDGSRVWLNAESSLRFPTAFTAKERTVELRGEGGPDAEEEARALLARVGLAERCDHYPVQLSGGEQQRVALARAFINRPKILFCDEPTGNLDTDTAAAMVELIFALNREKGATLVLVTHDLELAARCQRTLRLRSGAVVSDEQS